MNLETIASDLKSAQDRRQPVEPVTSRLPDFNIGAAYDVAGRIHAARLREGAAAIGRKIGFSNRNLWPLFDVHESIWAYVYDTTVTRSWDTRGRCSMGRFLEPRIEPEIVAHFSAAPPRSDDPAELLACIDWLALGFELVQSHFPGWKFKAADTIANSGLHGALIIGEPRSPHELGPDLIGRMARFTVTLNCNGGVRETGRGSNVLDSPLAAIAHLTAVLESQQAPPIGAGELVTTGSLTGAPLIQAGEVWSATLEGLALPGLALTLDP